MKCYEKYVYIYSALPYTDSILQIPLSRVQNISLYIFITEQLRVKGLAQGHRSGSMVVLGVELMTFQLAVLKALST